MTQFAIARHAESDWRLVKWDGSESEINRWDHEPTLEECLTALMDHHGTGNSPFSSRSGAIDAHLVSDAWPLPTTDKESEHPHPWQR